MLILLINIAETFLDSWNMATILKTPELRWPIRMGNSQFLLFLLKSLLAGDDPNLKFSQHILLLHTALFP